MLGSMIVFVGKKRGFSVVPVTRSQFDVLVHPVHELDSLIQEFLVESVCIINCIGCIPQKPYSDDTYVKINQEFPHALAEYCKERGYGLIHMSTNCVFDGTESLCVERDTRTAKDMYGLTKALGEPLYGLVIRSSIIGLERGTSSGLLSWFLTNSQPSIQGYTKQFWNGVTTLELANALFDTYVDSAWGSKILHIYSENAVSKYELLCQCRTVFEKDIEIVPFECPLKYYTLLSLTEQPRKSIYEQLKELRSIQEEFLSST